MPKITSGDMMVDYEADDKYFYLYRSSYHNILLSREDIPDIRKLLDEVENEKDVEEAAP